MGKIDVVEADTGEEETTSEEEDTKAHVKERSRKIQFHRFSKVFHEAVDVARVIEDEVIF